VLMANYVCITTRARVPNALLVSQLGAQLLGDLIAPLIRLISIPGRVLMHVYTKV